MKHKYWLIFLGLIAFVGMGSIYLYPDENVDTGIERPFERRSRVLDDAEPAPWHWHIPEDEEVATIQPAEPPPAKKDVVVPAVDRIQIYRGCGATRTGEPGQLEIP